MMILGDLLSSRRFQLHDTPFAAANFVVSHKGGCLKDWYGSTTSQTLDFPQFLTHPGEDGETFSGYSIYIFI